MNSFEIFFLVCILITAIPFVGLFTSLIGAWRDEKKYGLGNWSKIDD